MMADLGYICAYALWGKEALKVISAISHDGNSTGTLSFGGSTQPVTLKQSPYIGVKN